MTPIFVEGDAPAPRLPQELPECLGCTEGLPTLPVSTIARVTLPRGSKIGWRLCRRAAIQAWHIPPDQRADILKQARELETGAKPIGCDPVPPVKMPGARKPKVEGGAARGSPVEGSPLEDEIRGASTKVWRDLEWSVFDFEQGYRPDNCQSCGTPIPGARTRVPSGVADHLVVGHGFTIWIEYKRPGMKQSRNQIAFGNTIVRAGGHYFIVNDPVQVWAFTRFVRTHGHMPHPEQVGMPDRETELP